MTDRRGDRTAADIPATLAVMILQNPGRSRPAVLPRPAATAYRAYAAQRSVLELAVGTAAAVAGCGQRSRART